MAKLAWLIFTLVLLNSTVKINADFQLITTLAKLIESVEQMNSSISKINDRLEKLESTIPMKREHIVPDTEPKHGLIDNMIKTLEAEKLFIRKSVSAHEKKFQAFESQMKRHLSTIHTAIDSNKDNIEQQIKLINDTIDKNSETLEKELILININIDEKADALEQQMVLVNATIDSNKEMVETQIQRINVTIDKHCETLEKELRLINTTLERQYRKQRCSLSHGSLQLYNGNIKLNIAEHDSTVEVKCKNGDKYELKNTETNLYIDSLNTKCLFGHLDKDLSMLKCLPKRCSYSHGSLQLYSGNRQLNIAEHDSTVEVKCKNGDNYELKNTDTDQYIDSFNTKCLFGHLDKDLRILKCLPKPCDTNTLSDIDVYRDGIVMTGQVRSNVTYSLKCRPPRRWWERFAAYVFDVGAGEKPEQVERRCENGNFVNVPGCIAKPCESNNKYIDLYQLIPSNVHSEVSHGVQVRAKCKEAGYEMKDTNSGQYLSTFSTKCQYGVFDKYRAYLSLICLPKRCSYSDGSLQLYSGNTKLNTIEHDTTVEVTCKNGGNELKNTKTDQFINSFTTKCQFGNLDENLSVIKCFPKRCHNDNSDVVLNTDGRSTIVIPHGATVEVKCSSDKHELVDTKTGMYPANLITTCQYGEFDPSVSSLTCKEKRCFYGYASNVVHPSTSVSGYVKHGDSVAVKCENNRFGLRNNKTGEYIYNFSTECQYGVFNTNTEIRLLKCVPKEPQIECSLDLQHGIIKYNNGDYIPQCDTGYTLKNVLPGRPCECGVNNNIECFAKASPKCLANNCKLPYVFNGFSVYEKKKNDLFMSGGMEIKHGSSAYFNCSRGMENHNEPFDRQFKCELGKFMPVDGLEFDYSNDSTPVPLCRKAMCKHNCDNGGVCIRDDECQCPASTTGQWCETVLCDPSCERNGGKCVKPGQCGKCPAGRYGENCENEITCTLPTDLTMDNHRTIFRSGEPISAHMVICRYGTPSPGTMTCRADGSWDGEITCIRNEIKYSVRLHVSANTYANKHSAGTADNVFLRFVGQNVQTDTFQLKGDFGGNKLVEMEYRGTDVRPIHYVIVSKDMGILIDNNLSLVFVSIYIEDSDEYYVFTGRSLHTWLTASQPLTLTVSDHPENCASHTYGGAFYRHPKQRGMSVGFLTLLECKKWCVTSRSISCKSVYYIPSSRLGKGHCYHYEHSPDDDKYFRDNNRRETNVSYERICKATEID